MVRIIVAAKGVPRVQYPVPGKIQMVVLDKIIQVGGAKVVLFGAKCVFQIKLIKEKICANFKPTGEEPAVYDYDTAINRYKLALFNTLVKKGKASEKAYTCLKISWLYRGKLEGMDEKDASLEQERSKYREKKNRMKDADYYAIRKREDEIEEGIQKGIDWLNQIYEEVKA